MPIYEYRCENGHQFEVSRRISDDPLVECVTCSEPVVKIFHPVAVHFKGSGFYNTDYGTRKRARETSEAKESVGAKSSSESGTGSSSGNGSGSSSGNGSGSSSESGSGSSSDKSDSGGKAKAKAKPESSSASTTSTSSKSSTRSRD
ncbi:MAG: FmdB family zinc ribbon protein [Solirubrobacteraceae bacterium]